MAVPLLRNKFSLPPKRPRLVSRPRLIERLNAGLQGKLSLVSAPAGYGKTTLVVEWLSQLPTDYSLTWLSLDEGDNDPVRFLAYLIAAIEQTHPNFGETTSALLHSPQPPPGEVILTTLVNEISAIPTPIVLVLDDYHSIQNAAIHQQIAGLLEHQPSQLHLALVTREDPLLPIARLRAHGQASEIRQGDLRFNLEECADFIQGTMGIPLAEEDIAALERRTEGWIAGLQLAALSMQGRDDLKGFVQSFTGSSRFILDYLMEEVFERQSPEVKEFLLKTSILDRLSGPLCNAVTEKNDGQELLEVLEQANLFILPLDQSRDWYRYHRLFAELLRNRLRSSAPDDEPLLHARASRWYESEDSIAEAIQHALAARDWERSADLIGVSMDAMLKRGEVQTLIGWFRALPDDIFTSNPKLCFDYSWPLLLAGQFDVAGPLLERIEQTFQDSPALLGDVLAAQAYLARSLGDHALMVEKSQQALALLPKSSAHSRGIVTLNLGLAYWHMGLLREAVPALNEAQAIASQTEDYYAGLTAQIFLARTLASQGALRQAEDQLREIILTGGRIPILALAHYDLSGIYYEWDDLENAWEHLNQGLDICTRNGNLEFQNGGYLLKACLLMAQGDMRDALVEAENSYALSREFGPATLARNLACQSQIAMAMGDPSTAQYLTEQMTEDVDVHSFYRFLNLTRARLFLAQGEKASARELLADRLARAEKAGWGYATVPIRALLALAMEKEEAALDILVEGLKLSQPEGFVRSYVDAGAGLIPLLQEAAQRGIAPEYIGQILGAFRKTHRLHPDQTRLVEPLSKRELEVLRLVVAGLSNREIANKLVISLGTAKTHIHNIYGKLEVSNRAQAIARAGKLDLT